MSEADERQERARKRLGEIAMDRLKGEVALDVDRRVARIEAIPQAVWNRAVEADEGEETGIAPA